MPITNGHIYIELPIITPTDVEIMNIIYELDVNNVQTLLTTCKIKLIMRTGRLPMLQITRNKPHVIISKQTNKTFMEDLRVTELSKD